MSSVPSVSGSELSRLRAGFEEDTFNSDGSSSYLQFSSTNVGNEKLSILIVSTQNICDKIKTSLSTIISQKYNGNIYIKLAENIEQILDSGLNNTTVDYIVIIFDTTRKNNIIKLKEEILKLECSYIATRRICFVNGSPNGGIKGADLEINELAQLYNLLHLNGQVMNDNCERLCERILELVTVSCGFMGGAPFIIPTATDVYRQLFI